jgi:radical SAM protein with 4Fe4S-binding SPASM domain
MNSPASRALLAPAPPGKGASPLPEFVQIEPVGLCNLRCRMCSVPFRKESAAFIDIEVYRHLIEGFPTLKDLQLQGLGEPMLHPQFFEMVSYATARGIRVSTNTNLTLLTPDRARQCVDSGLHALHASIDGASAETYESIRLGASFKKVVRNLDRLLAAKREAQSDTPYCRIVMVIMRRNLNELPDIVRLAHSHGVDRIFVQHLCHDYSESTLPAAYRTMRDFIDVEELSGLPYAEVEAAFQQAREVADDLSVELRLPSLAALYPQHEITQARGCDWPMRGAYISYRGDAMPCCMVSTPDRANLGNMARQEIIKVWNGPMYRSFRNALRSSNPPEICRGCGIYKGTF